MVAVKKYKRWKMSEIQVLRDKYPTNSTRELAEFFGCSENNLRRTASMYQISKNVDIDLMHGSFKLQRIMELIQLLHRTPSRVQAIQDLLCVSERTVYRYISLLIASGIKVEKTGLRYSITFHDCPLCGHTTNNQLQ